MKFLQLFLCLVLLTACDDNWEKQNQQPRPPFLWATPVLVFKHDGCKIYQFKDVDTYYTNTYKYFAKCECK